MSTYMARYLVLVLLVSIPAPVWASELFGTISYKGKPLKNAEITVKDQKTTTNEIGYYSVDLEPGAYTLTIKLPDGATKEAKVDVFPQDTEKNLKLD